MLQSKPETKLKRSELALEVAKTIKLKIDK